MEAGFWFWGGDDWTLISCQLSLLGVVVETRHLTFNVIHPHADARRIEQKRMKERLEIPTQPPWFTVLFVEASLSCLPSM